MGKQLPDSYFAAVAIKLDQIVIQAACKNALARIDDIVRQSGSSDEIESILDQIELIMSLSDKTDQNAKKICVELYN